MKLQQNRLTTRTLVGLSLAALAPLSHAGVPIDTIGGSEISFEGMIQADGYWYDNDLANLDGDPGDGSDHDFQVRRADCQVD